MPFRLITNTTTHTRSDLAVTLNEAGFEVEPAEIITAVVATAAYLRSDHPGERDLRVVRRRRQSVTSRTWNWSRILVRRT